MGSYVCSPIKCLTSIRGVLDLIPRIAPLMCDDYSPCIQEVEAGRSEIQGSEIQGLEIQG